MTDELKTDKEEDADELFQQHIEAQCKRLRILGFTGTPIIRGNLNAMDKSLLPTLQTVCTEILNNIAKHGKPGAFAFVLSIESDEVRIFASNLYSDAMNNVPENHYGTTLIQDFAQQHNGTMTINSENEEMVIVPSDSANSSNTLNQPPAFIHGGFPLFIYGNNKIRIADIDNGQ